MAYTVLARRYRSREFDEIIGQEAIARTLTRAIDTNRVAHAYLFCGTRGVGKTSMARVFAKALNADPDLAERDAIAEAIMRGDDIDVIEIDGASNRGVDEARDLIAKSIYRPARCPHKIYIIDEVHMLTREAFNALLKTMEEPPEHVKFILCTTEPHKVPATIQSRCQRFDFRNIPTKQIADHLRSVLEREEIKADEDAVLQIARLANGSMRDGLSLLDRVIAASTGEVSAALLQEMLGVPARERIASMIEAMADGDANEVLAQSNELIMTGTAADQVIESIIDVLRTMMLASTCGARAAEVIDEPAEEIERLRTLAARFDVAAIVHMIVILENVQRAMRVSTTGRALFDAVLVRLSLSEKFADAAALLAGSDAAVKSTVAAPAKSKRSTQKKNLGERNSETTEVVHDASNGLPPEPPVTPTQAIESKPASNTSAANIDAPSPASSPASEDTTSPPTGSLDGDDLWQSLEQTAEQSPALAAILDHLSLERIEGRRVVLALNDATQFVQTKNNLEWISSLLTKRAGQPVQAELHVVSEDAPGAAFTAPTDRGRLTREAREEATSIPLVQKAMEILDARIIAVADAPAAGRTGEFDGPESVEDTATA